MSPKRHLPRVMITGANGMLGSDLTEVFREKLGVDSVLATDLPELDITHPEQLNEFVRIHEPEVVINAAAYTDVDRAETETDKAYLLNVTGPKNLAKVCGDSAIRLIHFSTDHVFCGDRDIPWREEDEPNPANYYAKTKLWGERSVLDYPMGLVLRIQWLYGKKKDRFTTLQQKDVFTPFEDQFGAPTWTRRVSEVVFRLMEKQGSGLFHFAYDDHASWAEVFDFVKDELKLSTTLLPKKTNDVSLPAQRPKYSVLSNEKLRDFLGVSEVGSWKRDLGVFLEQRAKER